MNNNLDIFDLAPVIGNVCICIEFLHGRNLLLNDLFCCGVQCSKVTDISISDKQIFQCNVCKKRQSIRTGSFWSKSKLPLITLVSILYFFAQDLTISQTHKLMKNHVSEKSIIEWYNYFRDLTTTYFENNPVRFDNNSTVHCDETFIGCKRKYGKGRVFPRNKKRILFGIIDNTKHKEFIEFIPKSNHPSIIPIITRHVPPGCTINTDGASVYKVLGRHMNYNHNFVIHKREYVTADGIHSNWIEKFWSNLKAKLKSIRGSQGSMVDGHLDEYLYRYNRRNKGSMFELLLQDIAHFYRI